jgi:hypothetical protein
VYVNLLTAPGAGNSHGYTLRVSNTDTVFGVTLAGATQDASASGMATLGAFDRLAMRVTLTGFPGSLCMPRWAFLFTDLGITTPTPPSRLDVSWAVLETPSAPVQCVSVSPGPSICGPEHVLRWIEQTQRLTDGTEATRVTSDAPLNDPADYYCGRKEPRMLAFGEITRQLSDVRGQWQGATMRWREAEVDRAVRRRYASTLTYPVTNTTDVCRMIRESDWRDRDAARLMFIGHRLRSVPAEDLSIEHESGDSLARDLEVAGREVQAPRRLFSPLYTPGIPLALHGMPEPIVYGKVSDELSDATPPTMTASAEWGGFFVEGIYPNFGWAPIPGAPPAPSDVTLTELPGGAIDLGDQPGDRFGVLVFHTAADGTDSDPDTFDQNSPVEITLGADDAQLQVTWTEHGTPVTTTVLLGCFYFGWRPLQGVTVPAGTTSVTFDNCPSLAEVSVSDYSQLATGANQPGYVSFAWYHAAARMADGRWTQLSPIAGFGIARGYRRPIRIEITDIPVGATSIGVWKYGPGPSAFAGNLPIGMFEVPVSQTLPSSGHVYVDDDLRGTGLVTGVTAPLEQGVIDLAPYYGGLELVPLDGAYRPRWFVSSHANAQVTIYVDGVKQTTPGAWLWPGATGYLERFGTSRYRDFNGRRYSVVYGPPVGLDVDPETITLPARLTANVWGVEPSAQGTAAVLEDVHDQYLHWFLNFGPLGDYQTGDYLTAPTWAPIAEHCKIDGESWAVARDQAAAEISGGIRGGGILRERAPMRDWIARWNVSLDVRLGTNAAGQWVIVRHTASAVPATTYTEYRHIQANSVTFDPLHDEHWTAIPYRFGFHAVRNTWQDGLAEADTEDVAYGDERPGPTFDLYFIQAPAIAHYLMVDRVLERHKTLPWRVTFDTIDFCGTNTDLGAVIGLTGTWGLGVQGWVSFPVWIERQSIKPDVHRTQLAGRTNVPPHQPAAFGALQDEATMPIGNLGDETSSEPPPIGAFELADEGT